MCRINNRIDQSIDEFGNETFGGGLLNKAGDYSDARHIDSSVTLGNFSRSNRSSHGLLGLKNEINPNSSSNFFNINHQSQKYLDNKLITANFQSHKELEKKGSAGEFKTGPFLQFQQSFDKLKRKDDMLERSTFSRANGPRVSFQSMAANPVKPHNPMLARRSLAQKLTIENNQLNKDSRVNPMTKSLANVSFRGFQKSVNKF